MITRESHSMTVALSRLIELRPCSPRLPPFTRTRLKLIPVVLTLVACGSGDPKYDTFGEASSSGSSTTGEHTDTESTGASEQTTSDPDSTLNHDGSDADGMTTPNVVKNLDYDPPHGSPFPPVVVAQAREGSAPSAPEDAADRGGPCEHRPRGAKTATLDRVDHMLLLRGPKVTVVLQRRGRPVRGAIGAIGGAVGSIALDNTHRPFKRSPI